MEFRIGTVLRSGSSARPDTHRNRLEVEHQESPGLSIPQYGRRAESLVEREQMVPYSRRKYVAVYPVEPLPPECKTISACSGAYADQAKTASRSSVSVKAPAVCAGRNHRDGIVLPLARRSLPSFGRITLGAWLGLHDRAHLNRLVSTPP